jgi:hypothetical protein
LWERVGERVASIFTLSLMEQLAIPLGCQRTTTKWLVIALPLKGEGTIIRAFTENT